MSRTAIIGFLLAYVKSMRLYYSFITGIAGLVGWSYYQYVAYSPDTIALSTLRRVDERPSSATETALILVILFLAWGINQIVNDYLGLEEDRINAPDRPMVTGALHAPTALLLSAALMLGAGVATWLWLQPVAIIALAAGVALNVVYEYAKGHGIWGNVVFGVMITCCAAYGFLAAGPSEASLRTLPRIAMLAYIALLNGLMTYYTYFKDYAGDKAAGKQTLVVRYGLDRARAISMIAAFLPSLVFALVYFLSETWPIALNDVFLMLAALTVGLQLWTGVLFYNYPEGAMTYYALSFNFRACACAEAALIALFNPMLGILMFFLTYVLVGFLFNFHVNRRG